MKTYYYILGIVLAGLMLASCGESYEEKKALRLEQTKEQQRLEQKALKIGIVPTIDCLPVLVAQQEGYFAQMPDSFRVKHIGSAIEVEQALLKGSVNVGVSDVKRLEKVNEKSTRLVSLGTTNLYWLLIANKTSRVKDPKQLGDKLVAMTRFSALDYLTDCIFADYPTKETAFKIQVNDPNLRLEMLINNAMDVMWLPEPQATAAQLHGHKVIADSRSYNKQLATFAAAAKNGSLSERAKQLKVFITGYNRAADSLNKKGWKAYEPMLKEQFKVEQSTLEKIPEFKFSHLNMP